MIERSNVGVVNYITGRITLNPINITAGKTKAAQEIMEISGEKPVVNQIELNPFLQQQKIAEFCNKEGIHLTGYCPLARGRRFDDPELSRVSQETGKSPAQVMIRWALERGQTVIPKSSRPLRIEKNAEVFDFSLNEGQMRTLNGLDQGLRFCPNPLDMA